MEGFICIITAALILLSDPSSGGDIYSVSDSVNVSVGRSVFLETWYTISPSISHYTIRWRIGIQAILHSSINNCSIGPRGSPTWTIGDLTIYPKYTGRVEFYALNASLLLHELQVNDSGNYTAILSADGKWSTRSIQIDVHEDPHHNPSVSRAFAPQHIAIFSVRMTLCFLVLATLVYIIQGSHCSRAAASQGTQMID